jgi:hypothetical protein
MIRKILKKVFSNLVKEGIISPKIKSYYEENNKET